MISRREERTPRTSFDCSWVVELAIAQASPIKSYMYDSFTPGGRILTSTRLAVNIETLCAGGGMEHRTKSAVLRVLLGRSLIRCAHAVEQRSPRGEEKGRKEVIRVSFVCSRRHRQKNE